MVISVGTITSYFFGGLAFVADIIAVMTYIKSVRLKQYVDSFSQVVLIIAIFCIGVLLIYIGKTPEGISHNYILTFFAWLYFFMSFATLFLACYVVKGTHCPPKDYVAFALSSLIIYLLGVTLLFLTGSHIPILAYLFFFCAVMQCFYIAGEYGIKRVLEASNRSVSHYFLSEYPHFVHLIASDWNGLKSILKNGNDSVSEQRSPLPGISYTHLALDHVLLAYTFVLGVALLLINNPTLFVFNWLG